MKIELELTDEQIDAIISNDLISQIEAIEIWKERWDKGWEYDLDCFKHVLNFYKGE